MDLNPEYENCDFELEFTRNKYIMIAYICINVTQLVLHSLSPNLLCGQRSVRVVMAGGGGGGGGGGGVRVYYCRT